MKTNQKIMLWSCIVIYFLTKLLLFLEIPVGNFVKNHLADLLCMPIILSIIQWIIQRFNLHSEHQHVPLLAVFVLTIYWSVYFEFYLPTQKAIYTGDLIDVFMYFTGSAIFLIVQNQALFYKRKKKVQRSSY